MIEESGVVVAVDGAHARVARDGDGGCGSCGSGQGCGLSLWARFFGRRQNEFTVRNPKGARVGDRVLVGIPEQALVRGALLVYLLPLVAMLSAGVVAQELQGEAVSEMAVWMAAAVGLGAGLWFASVVAHRWRRDPRYVPVVLERQGDSSSRSVTLRRNFPESSLNKLDN